MHPCVSQTLTRYLADYLTHFHQTFINDALWDRDECFTVNLGSKDQRSRSQWNNICWNHHCTGGGMFDTVLDVSCRVRLSKFYLELRTLNSEAEIHTTTTLERSRPRRTWISNYTKIESRNSSSCSSIVINCYEKAGCWFWCVDWHKATQGLFGGGVILLTIGFILATFHICCRCCKESFSIGSAIGSFIVTGSRCTTVLLWRLSSLLLERVHKLYPDSWNGLMR